MKLTFNQRQIVEFWAKIKKNFALKNILLLTNLWYNICNFVGDKLDIIYLICLICIMYNNALHILHQQFICFYEGLQIRILDF